ncbi:MAG: hypothetical protein J6S14_13460 [Clostridia bacterium]|nr:hypothetical protein [Clostridia bacterium]
MRMTDGVNVYDVTDQAHIDAFKAKGWHEVTPETKKTKTEKVKAPEKSDE